jgi:hypothetical protein
VWADFLRKTRDRRSAQRRRICQHARNSVSVVSYAGSTRTPGISRHQS